MFVIVSKHSFHQSETAPWQSLDGDGSMSVVAAAA